MPGAFEPGSSTTPRPSTSPCLVAAQETQVRPLSAELSPEPGPLLALCMRVSDKPLQAVTDPHTRMPRPQLGASELRPVANGQPAGAENRREGIRLGASQGLRSGWGGFKEEDVPAPTLLTEPVASVSTEFHVPAPAACRASLWNGHERQGVLPLLDSEFLGEGPRAERVRSHHPKGSSPGPRPPGGLAVPLGHHLLSPQSPHDIPLD